MAESNEHYEWIDQARRRGLGGALSLLLDALEPLGPLGAQVLWVFQPVGGLLAGAESSAGGEALEAPAASSSCASTTKLLSQ
jgi:hypothetical protein